MRKSHTRATAAAAALAAGGLAAFALRPSSTPTVAVAVRNPAVEVRTEVIRRTIHITRHPPALRHHGPHGKRMRAGAQSAGAVMTSASGSRAGAAAVTAEGGAVATRVSGSHANRHTSGSGSTVVATRSSGSHGAVVAPSSAASLSTRTSGSHAAAPGQSHSSGGSVTTRTSGTHTGSGTSSRPVTTRTSASGGHDDGHDGGAGHSGGDD